MDFSQSVDGGGDASSRFILPAPVATASALRVGRPALAVSEPYCAAADRERT
jgi:hypothetical protein